ncbi:MAG: acyl-CoA dehydrogenase [Deltaproteobacteria bacterium]|nr:acyl-CoA dehydrogenase [Deltaproteobacteria bacterium]
MIGGEGQGFAIAQKWIEEGRVRGHGARPVGIASRALDMMIEYAKVRTTFGQPLANRQAIQFMIADSAMELHACRLMVYECAWRPRGRPLDPGPRRLRSHARVALGMVVPPGAQYPHHRRHTGSFTLAFGAAYYQESQGIKLD